MTSPAGPAPSAGPPPSAGPEPSAGPKPFPGPKPSAGPLLRVVAGHPTAEEVAALTVVLAARRAAQERAARAPSPAPGRLVTGWAQRSRLLRAPLAAGPGAWRRSARP